MRKIRRKTHAGVMFTVATFVIAFFVLNWFFGLELWAELPSWLLLLIPLLAAWAIASAAGENMISGRKAAGIAALCLLVSAPLAWNYLGVSGGGPGGGEGGGENQQIGENLPSYEGTLFKYQASFQYLSSEDNGPITNDLFMVFPCPNIDNEPVVSWENLSWRLLAFYENNGENVWQVEMEGDAMMEEVAIAEFVAPRTAQPWVLPVGVDNTSHGPKVRAKLNEGGTYPYDNSSSMYQNEIFRIEAMFTVPNENADKVTLANDQDEVWIAMSGYTGTNFKEVNGASWVKLSKWTGTQFQTVFENSETEWVLLPNEWQGYRLDA